MKNKWIKELESMTIWTPVGYKIKYSFPENGTEYDMLAADKHLVLNESYTISNIKVDTWVTSLQLEEIPVIWFNSCHFSNVDQVSSEIEDALSNQWQRGYQ